MTVTEAISVLTADQADLCLMRVSGSVQLKALDANAQGKLNWIQRDKILQDAVDAANEVAHGA